MTKEKILMGMLGLCATLHATTYTWTGGGNDGGLWTTPANWGVSAGYPNGDDDTAVFRSSADVQLNASVTLQYLDVKAGATVAVSATEAGSLTMNNTTTADSDVMSAPTAWTWPSAATASA